MKTVLLDGIESNDSIGERIRNILIEELKSLGWDTEHIVLKQSTIGNCAGDFFCWIRTPGVCIIDDDNRKIAASMMNNDLMIYLTPVTFGGYSSILKCMVDHQIQNILPDCTSIEGETHHKKRYDKYPKLLVVGYTEIPDETAESTFRLLVKRNSLNFYPGTAVCGIVTGDNSEDEIRSSVKSWLNDIDKGISSPVPLLTETDQVILDIFEIKNALLLVGSPKKKHSSSYILGEYLFDKLGDNQVRTDIVFLYDALNNAEKLQSLLDKINTVDLIILSSPVYIDALPGPVVEIFETIVQHRKGKINSGSPLFVAITNCGFPEAIHNDTALRISKIFSGQADLQWAGGLGLAPGAVVGDKPLATGGRMTAHIRESLGLTAKALSTGQPVPEEARNLMAKPVLPSWFPMPLYRFLGNVGWKIQARKYHTQKLLGNKPYFNTNKGE